MIKKNKKKIMYLFPYALAVGNTFSFFFYPVMVAIYVQWQHIPFFFYLQTFTIF